MHQPDSCRSVSVFRWPAFWLAAGSLVAFWLALCLCKPIKIVDERLHVGIAAALARGEWAALYAPPMLPGWHLLMALPMRLFGEQLLVARTANLVISLLGLWIVARIAALGQPHENPAAAQESARHRFLRFAWNPLFFPFFVLAYTDMAALTLLLAALLAQRSQRRTLSGLGLLGTCLMRQTHVLWLPLLAAWALADRTREARPVRAGIAIAPHLAVAALAVLTYAITGRLTLGTADYNPPGFNRAQFYLFAMCVGVLWLPVWIEYVPRVWAELLKTRLMRPLGAATAVSAVGVLAVAFHNPHGWNADLGFLRNWPLELMTYHLSARVGFSLAIALLVPAVWRWTRDQPRGLLITGLWLCSFVFLAAQQLAEPRYYFIPFALLNLLAEFTPGQSRFLTAWYAALSLGIALYVLRFGGAGGGVW